MSTFHRTLWRRVFAAMKRRLLAGLSFLAGAALIMTIAARPERIVVRGIVLDGSSPVAGANVRVQGGSSFVISGAAGEFAIVTTDAGVPITAWSPGYYVTAAPVTDAPMQIQLRRHPTEDHPAYRFISPSLDAEHPNACGRCHAGQPALPVDEWQQDAHAGAATNPRFLSLYNGTALDGTAEKPTAYRFDPETGLDIPAAAPAEQGGVGFRLDFPDQAGPCAACHVPVLALDTPFDADPNRAEGAAREGITCDFCHKLWDVRVGADGLPSPHLPGVLSVEMLRPPDGTQVFLGPFDDTPGDDVFSPLQNESRFCAACHSGAFWGVTMYNSFGEWLASPYSDPVKGQTCQGCHMPRVGVTSFVRLPPDVTQFVPERDPQTIFSHRMPGAADADLLQNTAALALDAQLDENGLHVTAVITNTNAGHHIPTDNPLRNLILVVDARDSRGNRLALLDGPTIPDWGGIGDPARGHYGGLPGVLYARILADVYTGEMPTAAYWRQTRLVSDNRIPALGSDQTIYRFRLPDEGDVTVEARLLFRRAFIELMEQKGWDTPDLLMEHEWLTIRR